MVPFATAAPALAEAGRRLDARGWAPATSGNYSMRLDDGSFAVTISGKHKGRLTPADIMRVHAAGNSIDGNRPSAETALHMALYELFPAANAVLHGHSPHAVGLSRAYPEAQEWVFAGHEMLKALPGFTTHAAEELLPIVDNSQVMAEIDAAIRSKLLAQRPAFAYLIRSHGLYAWGKDLDEAERVLEAVEWLISAELAERAFRMTSPLG